MGERAEPLGIMSRAIRESGSGHTVLCPGAEPDDKCQARFPLPGSGAKVQSTQMQNAKIPAILAGCTTLEKVEWILLRNNRMIINIIQHYFALARYSP